MRKAKRDTYKARSEILVKKAEEIVTITGCEAFVDIVPTWQRGKHWSYRSPGYSNENIPTQNSSVIEGNSLQASTPHFTPQKRQPKSRKEETDPEVCWICHVRYESLADIEMDSPWLNCAKECNWWVHARCVGVFYANSDRGEKHFRGYWILEFCNFLNNWKIN